MAQFENLDLGNFALIQQTKNGRIMQIGLTQEQSKQLQFYVALISKKAPILMLGEEHDLILKKEL